MYSLVALLALVQVWLLLLVLERRTWGRWLAFVLVAALGLYTHLHYALFLAGLAVTCLRERRVIPLGQSVLAFVAVGLLYVPNLFNLQEFMPRRGGEYAVHLPSALPKLAAAFTVGFNYFALPDQGLGRAVGTGDLARNLPLVAARRHSRPADRLRPAPPPPARPARPRALDRLRDLPRARAARPCRQRRHAPVLAPAQVCYLLRALCAVVRRPRIPGLAGPPAIPALTAVLGAVVVAISLAHFWNPADYGRRENWREGLALPARPHDAGVRRDRRSRHLLADGLLLARRACLPGAGLCARYRAASCVPSFSACAAASRANPTCTIYGGTFARISPIRATCCCTPSTIWACGPIPSILIHGSNSTTGA